MKNLRDFERLVLFPHPYFCIKWYGNNNKWCESCTIIWYLCINCAKITTIVAEISNPTSIICCCTISWDTRTRFSCQLFHFTIFGIFLIFFFLIMAFFWFECLTLYYYYYLLFLNSYYYFLPKKKTLTIIICDVKSYLIFIPKDISHNSQLKCMVSVRMQPRHFECTLTIIAWHMFPFFLLCKVVKFCFVLFFFFTISKQPYCGG